MTRLQVQALVAKWKRLLNLGDWSVTCSLEDGTELGSLGVCSVNAKRQQAYIRIAWPHPPKEDIESTVAHELLHLYFDAMDDDPKQDLYQSTRTEQGVDMVADLLVRLSREASKPKAVRKKRK